jgi:DNA-directed RNA polymerase beta subunit
MESDALVAHGTSMLLYEKLMDSADVLDVYVCTNCGGLAVDDKIRNKKYCPVCSGSTIEKVKISYGFKLLLDELKSLGIMPKLIIGDKIE